MSIYSLSKYTIDERGVTMKIDITNYIEKNDLEKNKDGIEGFVIKR